MPTILGILGNFAIASGAVLAIAYFAVCLFLFLRQNRFIFFPSPIIEKTPASVGVNYEDVWLPVSVGAGRVENMHGWWIPAASPEADVVLYLHGNGINMGANVNRAMWFHQLGLSVLKIDYRGYGRSQGNFPTEATVYQDVETAWDYLVEKRGIEPGRIFLYGHSLGGAIAIELALWHREVAGAIVESSFTSMRAMVANLYPLFRIFPVDLLLNQRFDSINKIKLLQMPVLLIHGTDDEMVPSGMSQQLFAAANEPKQLFLVPEACHNDVAEVGCEPYLQAVHQFVERVRARQKQQSVRG